MLRFSTDDAGIIGGSQLSKMRYPKFDNWLPFLLFRFAHCPLLFVRCNGTKIVRVCDDKLLRLRISLAVMFREGVENFCPSKDRLFRNGLGCFVNTCSLRQVIIGLGSVQSVNF